MACEFAVVMNPGPPRQVMLASDALDMIHALEAQMTVYRPQSELSQLNRRAAAEPVAVEQTLFDLLLQARDISDGDRRRLRSDVRSADRALATVPRGRTHSDATEIADTLAIVGMPHVHFEPDQKTIAFDRPGVELNLGAIGKGHAVDRAADFLCKRASTPGSFMAVTAACLCAGRMPAAMGGRSVSAIRSCRTSGWAR